MKNASHIAKTCVFAAVMSCALAARAGVTYSSIAGPSTAWPTTPSINFGNPPDAAGETASANTALGATFLAPAGNNYLSALYIYANGGSCTLDLHLYDLGVSAPGSSYNVGTDLFSGLSVAYGGQPSRAIQQFTFTGADQVVLTAGHYYAIEIFNEAASPNAFFWGRFGGAGSLYADGHMYSGTGTGARSFVSGGLDRDATGAIYLTEVPEPSTFVLAGIGAVALLAVRRRAS